MRKRSRCTSMRGSSWTFRISILITDSSFNFNFFKRRDDVGHCEGTGAQAHEGVKLDIPKFNFDF